MKEHVKSNEKLAVGIPYIPERNRLTEEGGGGNL
jgi:hypothetical protein